MRITVRIDDDILSELRQRAAAAKTSMASVLNEVLRRGLEASRRASYKQRVFSLGAPKFNVDKALAFAAELEDEEILRKLSMGK